MQPVHVIGGGLAGSEAAWQIASRGVPVMLHEMRPHQSTAAHKTGGLAELVCSNSCSVPMIATTMRSASSTRKCGGWDRW